MTVIKEVNSTCAECGVEFKKGYGITTSFSQARWKFLCKDCYSKITTDVEEEAEEFEIKVYGSCDTVKGMRGIYHSDIYEAYKDGAEFGYNKAKVEVEDSYRESLCNSELNLASVTEQLEELEKANEWHFVKDELPRTDDYYLVFDKGSRSVIIGMFTDGHFESCFPIAWKELPELPKESE